jgi:hypothetical protein
MAIEVRYTGRMTAAFGKLVLSGALALSAVGCMTMPRGVALGKPDMTAKQIDRTVWLARVETPMKGMQTSSEPLKESLDNTLTMNIKDYIERARYFQKVNLYRRGQESLNANDLVLKFKFDTLHQQNKPNPMYFPCSILTATLFIWCGGAVTYDCTDMSCRLVVEDAGARQLAVYKSEIKAKEGVSAYKAPFGGTVMDVAEKSGIRHRTIIVRSLLDEACGKLSGTNGGAQ